MTSPRSSQWMHRRVAQAYTKLASRWTTTGTLIVVKFTSERGRSHGSHAVVMLLLLGCMWLLCCPHAPLPSKAKAMSKWPQARHRLHRRKKPRVHSSANACKIIPSQQDKREQTKTKQRTNGHSELEGRLLRQTIYPTAKIKEDNQFDAVCLHSTTSPDEASDCGKERRGKVVFAKSVFLKNLFFARVGRGPLQRTVFREKLKKHPSNSR